MAKKRYIKRLSEEIEKTPLNPIGLMTAVTSAGVKNIADNVGMERLKQVSPDKSIVDDYLGIKISDSFNPSRQKYKLFEIEDRIDNKYAKGGKVVDKHIQQSFTSGAGQKFIQDLINAGLDMNSAIAIAANAWQESRLQPNAVNPESGAYGLLQWLGPRKKALFKKYAQKDENGKEYVSYEDQMKYFLEDELHSSAAWLGKNKRDAFHDANKDLYEKTFLFLKDFERPGDFDEEGRRRARFAYEINKAVADNTYEFDESNYPGYFKDTTRINVKPLEDSTDQSVISSAIQQQGNIVEENIEINRNISPSKFENEIKSRNLATRSGNPEPIEVQDNATQLLAQIEEEKMRMDFLQTVVDNLKMNPIRQTRDKGDRFFIGFGF